MVCVNCYKLDDFHVDLLSFSVNKRLTRVSQMQLCKYIDILKLKCSFKASTCLHARYRCRTETSAEAEIKSLH